MRTSLRWLGIPVSNMPRPVVRLLVGQRGADDCLAAGRYRRTIFRNRRDTPFPGASGGQTSATRAMGQIMTGQAKIHHHTGFFIGMRICHAQATMLPAVKIVSRCGLIHMHHES